MSSRRVRVEIAADKSEFEYTAFKFFNRVLEAGGFIVFYLLGQLADTDKIIGEKVDCSFNHIVAGLGPVDRGFSIANVGFHS